MVMPSAGVAHSVGPVRRAVDVAYTAACLVAVPVCLLAGLPIAAALVLTGVALHWAAVHSQK